MLDVVLVLPVLFDCGLVAGQTAGVGVAAAVAVAFGALWVLLPWRAIRRSPQQ